MTKVLNVTGWLVVVWVIFLGIWNIANFEGFSGELMGAQRFEGILALAVGIGLIVILLKLRRK